MWYLKLSSMDSITITYAVYMQLHMQIYILGCVFYFRECDVHVDLPCELS